MHIDPHHCKSATVSQMTIFTCCPEGWKCTLCAKTQGIKQSCDVQKYNAFT